MKSFSQATGFYRKKIGKIKGKSVLIVLEKGQRNALASLPALLFAIAKNEGDIFVHIKGTDSITLDIFKVIWNCYNELKYKAKSKNTQALKKMLSSVKEKKCFMPPEIFLKAGKKGFEGRYFLPYCKVGKGKSILKIARKGKQKKRIMIVSKEVEEKIIFSLIHDIQSIRNMAEMMISVSSKKERISRMYLLLLANASSLNKQTGILGIRRLRKFTSLLRI